MADNNAMPKMPQDLEAEKSVLSAMILAPDALQDLLLQLREEDFFLPRHRIIFTAIKEMFDANMPIDTIGLSDALKTKKQLDAIGGPAYLLELSSNTLALSSWRRHVEMLRRDTTLRNIIVASSEITSLAFNAPEDTKEVVDSAEKLIMDVTDRDVRNSFLKMGDAINQLYKDLDEQAKLDADSLGVRTGFPRLDKLLLGLRPGQLIVGGARPGVGKTSFALNLAVQAAERGASVAFFSLEMSSTEIAQRLMSARSSIPLQKIRSARIAGEDWAELNSAAGHLSCLDIMIDDTPGTTVTEIRAKARRMLRDKEKGLIIVDYLQLMQASGNRYDSRVTEVSAMSRGLKIMAKDLGVPVVSLSQLSRQSEARVGKRPQLSDLRESGSIEQDADIVILLDRSTTAEEAQRSDRPDEGWTDFIIAKNRSGPTGTIPMIFLNESTQFKEVDFGHDEQEAVPASAENRPVISSELEPPVSPQA